MDNFNERGPVGTFSKVQHRNVDNDIVWGAEEIAKAINRPVTAVQHMLKLGVVPGAIKIGGRWALSRRKFNEAFGAFPPNAESGS